MPGTGQELAKLPAKRLVRRTETNADQAFLFELFCLSWPGGSDFPFLDSILRETLLRQQFDAQTAGYHSSYPDACAEIIEVNDAPIGRVLTDRGSDSILVVDIAILPQWRGLAYGARVLREICVEAQKAKVPVRLSVFIQNQGALRLYRRLGFERVAAFGVHLTMEWSGHRITPCGPFDPERDTDASESTST